jgi:heat shock protein HslJ
MNRMNRVVTMRALLGVALAVTTFPLTATAQLEPAPEGLDWHLVSYVVDGEQHEVPGSMNATIWLEAGRVIGSSGCNSLAGAYEIAGEAITFIAVGLDTEVGCSDAGKELQTGYLVALPDTASWAMGIDTDPGPTTVHGLELRHAAGDTILTFEEPSLGQTYADVRELIALVDAQQRQIDRLTQQVRRNAQAGRGVVLSSACQRS